MNWSRPNHLPLQERTMYLIVTNNQLVADIMLWDKTRNVFYSSQYDRGQGALDVASVQAVAEFSGIPRPEWLQDTMAERDAENFETLRLASIYREYKRDLFGNVVDPDDVAGILW